MAENLGKIRGTLIDSAFFLICPESRKKDEKIKKINANTEIAIISWEKIAEKFRSILPVLDAKYKTILKEFCDYLTDNITFIKGYEKKLLIYNKFFVPNGTEIQREFVRKLWGIFPHSGSKISAGKTWVGYYFYDSKEIWDNGYRGWFGFVSTKDEIKKAIVNFSLREAEFIIVTTYKPEKLPEEFFEVKLKNEKFVPNKNGLNAWVVNFNDKWNSLPYWSEKIKAFKLDETNLVKK